MLIIELIIVLAAIFLGARLALEKAGATFDRVSVPGVLEIPAAMSMAPVNASENFRKPPS